MSKESTDSYFSFENVQKRAAALRGRAKEIAEGLLAERWLKLAKLQWNPSKTEIEELFWKKDVGDATNFDKVMSPGSDERQAVEALAGKDNAHLAAKMWERASLYPYQDSIYRRHYRTKKYAPLYLSKNLYTLLGFIAAVADGFTLDVYLKERVKGDKAKDFGRERSFVPPLLAALLDEGGKASNALFARLSEIVLDESGRAMVTREIIAGLLQSRRGDAHELVGKLLLAARLQEGLRQAVLEEADMGSREGFMYLFKLALDENLIRFSSVSRAFCVWLGIDFDVVSASGAKRIKQTYEDAWKCLTDEAFRAECLNGKDAQKISLAL
ncbi:MAG: hypothetical protein LBC93_07385, partial [Synergistaceae bacterium]|nr:hypothetical protein [Synergistaceae bacterium]